MDPNEIKAMIEAGIPNCEAQVMGDDGSHFDAIVVSPEFEGKSMLQEQRMVYGTLGDSITSGRLHALSIKAYTPAEWAAKKG
ncbi:MAG: BolA family transcriptional regulator [Chromatiales bacterium]|nr:BolA family transcriptional regulator [Gammaproteobacteria bacterium]MCP5352862.1 BolA family transcriptional regulator [Chromatiales bacterium]